MKNLIYLVLLMLSQVAIGQDTILVRAGQQIVIIGSGEDIIDDPVTEKTKFYVNTTNNIDHFPNLRGAGTRYFWNVGHDLPSRGILKNGGLLARDHTFVSIINECIGQTYDGTMCDNAMRVDRLSKQFDVICLVMQSVMGPFENWLGWPNKYVAMWIWGNTPGEQYAKIKEHTKAALASTRGKVQFFQIANEPWGMTAEQYNIVESARIDGWIEDNIEQGKSLENYEDFEPKLIMAAMPIGQGLETELTFANLVGSNYKKYYHSVAVHAYNRTAFGEWSTDASISNEIIDKAFAFCKEHMPHCRLQVTETGGPNEMLDQHIQSIKDRDDEEPIYAAWIYNLFTDDSDIFKDTYLIYPERDDIPTELHGTITEAAKKYNLVSSIK